MSFFSTNIFQYCLKHKINQNIPNFFYEVESILPVFIEFRIKSSKWKKFKFSKLNGDS